MGTFHNILTPDDDLQAVLDQSSPGDFIQLSEGDFRIKCTVFVPSLTIRGAGMDKTRIIWDDYANKIHADGKEYNTFRTWTMAVCADHVTMEDLAVVNDSLHPETKGQEVALTVYADDFETVYSTADIHCELPGYYTIPLDEPVAVDGFVVAVDYGDQIPCEGRTRNAEDRTYEFTSEEGQSYVYYQGEWIDVTDSVALRRLSTYDPLNNFFIVALMD